MKAPLLVAIVTVAAGIAAHAQNPNVPPPGLPQRPGNAQPGNAPERAEHIGEALKHLQAAGLGEVAEHLEQMLRMHDGRGQSPSGRPQPQGPSGPPQRPNQPGAGKAFGAPFTPPMLGPRGPANAQSREGNDDLRAQVQRLAREVEELRKLVGNRGGEHRHGGPRGGEHRHHGGSRGDHQRPTQQSRPDGNKDATPQSGDRRDQRGPNGQPQAKPQGGGDNQGRRPQGDRPQAKPQGGGDNQGRRPQGDRPQAKPQGGGDNQGRRPQGDPPQRPPGDGPRRENRDAPPQPKRDGAEEIKPALLPQTDSIE